MRELSLVRLSPGAARGAVMALALAGGACFDTMAGLTEVLSNQVLAPHDKPLFGCAESRMFADSPLIGTVGFDGPTRDRADVAVLVIPGWYGPWTLQVRSVDNRQVPGECRLGEGGPAGAVEPASGNPPDARPVQECLRVAVLPGQRVVRLSVSSKGYGSAWENTKVKGARIDATVVFPARLGGLYSAHVCRPRQSEKTVFWIRDEHTRTCVSAACPPVEEPYAQ